MRHYDPTPVHPRFCGILLAAGGPKTTFNTTAPVASPAEGLRGSTVEPNTVEGAASMPLAEASDGAAGPAVDAAVEGGAAAAAAAAPLLVDAAAVTDGHGAAPGGAAAGLPDSESLRARDKVAGRASTASGPQVTGAGAVPAVALALEGTALDAAAVASFLGTAQAVVATSRMGALEHTLADLLLGCLQPHGVDSAAGGGAAAAAAPPPRQLLLWETPFAVEFLGPNKILNTWAMVRSQAPAWQSELVSALGLLGECCEAFGVGTSATGDTLVLLACFLQLSL